MVITNYRVNKELMMKKFYNILITTLTVLFYLITVAVWIAIPDEVILNLCILVVTLCLTLISLYLNKETFKNLYMSHQFKKFQEMILFLFLVFCILGLVNYWAFKHPIQYDVTDIKVNTLSDQTKKILKNLDAPLELMVFSRKADSYAWLALAEFFRAEKPDLTVTFIDIDARPDMVRQYNILAPASMGIKYKDHIQFVTVRDELNISNAIVKLSRTESPIVYYLQGQGEANFQNAEGQGYKLIYEAVKNTGINILPLNFLTYKEVPADAKALIIWGPRQGLNEEDISKIKNYMDKGGNLLIALDPDMSLDKNTHFREFLTGYRILVRNDLVIDKKSFVNGSNGSIPLINYNASEHAGHSHEDHVILRDFNGEVFFPLTSSLSALDEKVLEGVEGQATNLLHTSEAPDSWSEKSLKDFVNNNLVYNEGVDEPGPLNVMASFESPKNRVVAFGNSSFVANNYARYGNNFLLFVNSLNWTMGEDRLVSFDAPIIQSEPIFISAPQLGVIFYFSVFFAPLILFIIAILVYRRKRNK